MVLLAGDGEEDLQEDRLAPLRGTVVDLAGVTASIPTARAPIRDPDRLLPAATAVLRARTRLDLDPRLDDEVEEKVAMTIMTKIDDAVPATTAIELVVILAAVAEDIVEQERLNGKGKGDARHSDGHSKERGIRGYKQ